MHRSVRALAVGATAAAAYLAGSRLREVMPVRPSALAVLATLGIAAVMSSSGCAKAYAVDQRLAALLANGFAVNGRIDILSGNLHMHGNNINLEGGSVVP
jgi:hypothetical protein